MSYAERVADKRAFGSEGDLDGHAAALGRAAAAVGIKTFVEPELDAKGRQRARLRLDIGGESYFYRNAILRVAGKPGRLTRHINGDAALTTTSKGTTKAVLAAVGLSVPRGRVFDANHRAEAIGFALSFRGGACIKPEDATEGLLVAPYCRRREAIEEALDAVFKARGLAIVEESVPGGVYRFIYVEPAIVGVRRTRPVSVVGDGKQTVLALVSAINAERQRRRLPSHDPLKIDLNLTNYLATQLLTLNAVPRTGRRISLSADYGLVRGTGEVVNLGPTDVHDSHWRNALMAFRAIEGLRIGALDMKIVDPLQPATAGSCWILEINSSPAIDSAATPWVGEPQDVVGPIVALLRRHADEASAAATAAPEERPSEPDPHAVLVRAAAERRGIATRVVKIARRGVPEPHLRFSIGAQEYDYRYGALRVVDSATPDLPGPHINGEAEAILLRKSWTKRLVAEAGLTVPAGRCFPSAAVQDAIAFAEALAVPVCVKPECGKKGRGVTTNRTGAIAVEQAFRRVAKAYDEVLVEESVDGDELRFFYVAPKAVAVKMSIIPEIVGDGASSVLGLLATKTRDDAARMLANQTSVAANHDLVAILAEQGLCLEDVPEPGTRIRLRHAANGAGGGGHIECRDTIHPSWWEIAERAFHAIPGLVVASLDMKAADSRAPAENGRYWILEINNNPGVLPYHYPWEGRPQDVSGAIIEHLMRSKVSAAG